MINKIKYISYIILMAALFLSINCDSRKDSLDLSTKPVSLKQFETKSGADPEVSPENGGAGFTGIGWITNDKYNIIGKKEAVKGGKFTITIPSFPSSLRVLGKESNHELNDRLSVLMYECLLNIDPVDKSLCPALATHWKIDKDSVTFLFRINPDARWADGTPVTVQDVAATFKLMADTTILQPPNNELINSFEPPIIISKYIFSIKSKTNNWRQLFYLSNIPVLPAKIISNISGRDYLEQYQYKYIMGSGPFVILEKDIKKGESITLRRRSDYWAENEKYNIGKFNFDEITFTVIADDLLEFEKFKKGELDLYNIRQPDFLLTGFDFDYANRNIILRKKIFNDAPLGPTGLVFNMREYPFNDIRIRKAFIHLFDKMKLNEKLYSNSYSLFNSYFPNSVYSNSSNPVVGYNYDSAIFLLREAGWIFNNGKGTLEKAGKKLEVTIPFSKPMDRYLTIYQEELQKAGIKLNLKETDGATRFSLGNDRKFTIIPIAWSGLLFPNPVTNLSIESADMKNTNNWFGIKDYRIDSLCKLYDIAYTIQEQINILREIDKIAYSYFGIINGFYKPYQAIAFQNKFGYPDGIISRYDRFSTIFYYWYIDPEKFRKYENAKSDKSLQLPQEELENNYWKKYENK